MTPGRSDGHDFPPTVRATFALLLLVGTVELAFLATGLGGSVLAGTTGDVLYDGMLVGAAALCVARAIRDPHERTAWALIAAAVSLWAAGDVVWTVSVHLGVEPPFPSWSDALWLGFYPPAFAAFVLLARKRVRGLERSLWIDGVIAALAVAAVSAAIVFDAVQQATSGDPAAVAVNLAYPLADLLLLAMLVAIVASARPHGREMWGWLGAGLTTFVIADSIYLVQVAKDTYVPNHVLDIGWPLALGLIARAAWTRSPSGPVRRVDSGIRSPIALALVALGVLAYGGISGHTQGLAVVLAAGSIAAALVRLVLTHAESRRRLELLHLQSVTDPLTGLGNRVMLLEDLDRARQHQRAVLMILLDLDGFKDYNDGFGHPAGDALLARVAGRLAEVMPPGGEAYRMGGDEFCCLMPLSETTDVPSCVALARAALSEVGNGFRIGASAGHALIPAEATNASDALRVADQRLYADKSSGRVSAQRQSTNVLLGVMAERDAALAVHLRDVASLAARIARRLGLSPGDVELVAIAAELHDVGKAAIPDSILLKPGPLTAAEWVFMREHTIIGERILAAAPALARVGQIVRSTHERYDGAGYPDQLEGADIPLESRIVYVCDAFHAMTSHRSYRAPMDDAAALRELREHAGTQFDPVVVDAFHAELAAAPAERDPAPVEPSALGRR